MKISDYATSSAPAGTTRLIPSRFPPIPTFDAVTTPDDLEAVMELEGWTNDRLISPRLARLPRAEWVYGVPNASVRHPGHENWVCFRPPLIQNVTQAQHFRIEVPRTGRVVVRQLS